MSRDSIGARMKENYENRTKVLLPRRTYTIIRLDGKAFHTFTKGFDRPYDADLMKLMDTAAHSLLKQIQGAKIAYVQSDEISLLLTDFETPTTDAWFDGSIQKMASISASMATAAFNAKAAKMAEGNFTPNGMALPCYLKFLDKGAVKTAFFDSRVFTIPDREEVFNYFLWRQQDATRNSIQMGAQSMYSHKELQGKNTSELQEMMFQKGTNWNDYPDGFKRGRIIIKEKTEILGENGSAIRTKINTYAAPIFSQAKDKILKLIPNKDNV